MRKLPTIYNKNGYEHQVLWRDEEFAITEVRDLETKMVYCFEAFKIKVRKPSEIKGKNYPASESSPCNESWGVYGFTLPTLEKAKNKINQLKLKKNGKN
jgi:hypothetical protein